LRARQQDWSVILSPKTDPWSHESQPSPIPSPKSGRRYYNKQGVAVADIDVPSVTVDNFCAQSGIDHIDILKLDVQGGELLALEGTKHMLSRTAVTLIYAEVVDRFEPEPY